jgi:hypothetical protein
VGFVVGKVALGQVFSEHFGSPANSHCTDCSTIIIIIIICHVGLVQQAERWPQYHNGVESGYVISAGAQPTCEQNPLQLHFPCNS